VPLYRTTLLTAGGRRLSEIIPAPNRESLDALVRSRGAFVMKAVEAAPHSRLRGVRLPEEHVIEIYNLLAMVLHPGILTEEAIATLKRDYPDRRARAMLAEIHAALVVSKDSISQAFAQFPRTFPPSAIASIAAGELQGVAGLARRFAGLRDLAQFKRAIRGKFIRMSAYPALLLAIAGGLLAFLLTGLFPKLAALLEALNSELPAITRGVIRVSSLLQAHGPELIAGLLAGLVGLRLAYLVPALALRLDGLVLRLPLAGTIYRYLLTAELAKNYAALYAAGEQTVEIFRSCAAISANRAVRASLHAAREQIETSVSHPPVGAAADHDALPIAAAFASTGCLPPLAITLIRSGERTGSLTEALNQVAGHYAQAASASTDRALAVFEKALFLIIAALVGTVVIAMLQPLFSLMRSLR